MERSVICRDGGEDFADARDARCASSGAAKPWVPPAALAALRRRIGRAWMAWGRRRLVRRWVRGSGLELGALHAPLAVPHGVEVTYVDRLPVEGLRHHYPELAGEALVEVGVVDDAETLATVADASQDFVLASHLLEHCEDPLGAVANWLRVVRAGGAVLLAVPDGRFTFDSGRPTTPVDHVLRDRREGSATSRSGHYAEWARLVERRPESEIAARAAELEAARHSIHFHVWDFAALAALLEAAVDESPRPARVAALRRNRSENLAVLVRAESR